MARLRHLAILTENVERLVRFYTRILRGRESFLSRDEALERSADFSDAGTCHVCSIAQMRHSPVSGIPKT